VIILENGTQHSVAVYFILSISQHQGNIKYNYLQTRIILNKADQVRPEELMRVQGTLIWNISPLMSSSEPPVMYSTSLWSLPYEAGAPTRLLSAQERAFLRDLRDAIDKRVENKIASARRFAVSINTYKNGCLCICVCVCVCVCVRA
jgi:hypothetical protein